MRRCCFIHEKELDVPAATVEFGDVARAQLKVVREKDEQLVIYAVVELHATQRCGVLLVGK